MVANHKIQGKGEVRQSLSTWKPAALGEGAIYLQYTIQLQLAVLFMVAMALAI